MNEKRFTIPKGYRVIKDNVTDKCAIFYDNGGGETFLKWLNELHEENQSLKFQLDECRNNKLFSRRQLEKENGQLKQRNTNQYNQLNELWEIIEEENWEKLIAMKKQLKEDEERLQKEWKCYE